MLYMRMAVVCMKKFDFPYYCCGPIYFSYNKENLDDTGLLAISLKKLILRDIF